MVMKKNKYLYSKNKEKIESEIFLFLRLFSVSTMEYLRLN